MQAEERESKGIGGIRWKWSREKRKKKGRKECLRDIRKGVWDYDVEWVEKYGVHGAEKWKEKGELERKRLEGNKSRENSLKVFECRNGEKK